MSQRSREELEELGNSAKRAMLIFQDSIARFSIASHMGEDAEPFRHMAHDSLDAYFDHVRILNGVR